MYSAMSSISSGGPPGRTRTQELWYSLRGTDARLESVLSTDKCLCDACCARFSTPNFVVLFSYFGLKIFFWPKQIFWPKNICRKFFCAKKERKKTKKVLVFAKSNREKAFDDRSNVTHRRKTLLPSLHRVPLKNYHRKRLLGSDREREDYFGL